jgi:serine/threonine protein kinase
MDKHKYPAHQEAIKREVFVLKELSSCLNVAKLEDVFESDTHVHIVQELCEGGELQHSIGKSHYSERTV